MWFTTSALFELNQAVYHFEFSSVWYSIACLPSVSLLPYIFAESVCPKCNKQKAACSNCPFFLIWQWKKMNITFIRPWNFRLSSPCNFLHADCYLLYFRINKRFTSQGFQVRRKIGLCPLNFLLTLTSNNFNEALWQKGTTWWQSKVSDHLRRHG